ncbi:MAG: hypothetical protein C3F13_11500 [Anaerolineales bacterium]|nr:hypothetical protein [Anaerolineae bacterium]PWB52382.1 MAG: hypothetical protein C3F13_11500 [Anaerolineales bacterium]
MGFSMQQYKKGHEEERYKIHPIWRGIGCILLILVPIMSWYIATLFLESNKKVVLPYEFSQVISIPRIHVAAVDKIIVQANQYFSNTHFMFGQIFLTVIFSFIGFGIIALLYGIIYRMTGPPRYGPFDVPPNKV